MSASGARGGLRSLEDVYEEPKDRFPEHYQDLPSRSMMPSPVDYDDKTPRHAPEAFKPLPQGLQVPSLVPTSQPTASQPPGVSPVDRYHSQIAPPATHPQSGQQQPQGLPAYFDPQALQGMQHPPFGRPPTQGPSSVGRVQQQQPGSTPHPQQQQARPGPSQGGMIAGGPPKPTTTPPQGNQQARAQIGGQAMQMAREYLQEQGITEETSTSINQFKLTQAQHAYETVLADQVSGNHNPVILAAMGQVIITLRRMIEDFQTKVANELHPTEEHGA